MLAVCRPLALVLGLVPIFAGLMDTQQTCLLHCIDIIFFDFVMLFTVGGTADTYDFMSLGRVHDPFFVVAVAIHGFTSLRMRVIYASEYGAHCQVET